MSNYCTIPNFSSYMVCSDGYVINTVTGDVIRGSVKRTGYVEVCLTDNDGDRRSLLLHRLVAKAFCNREGEGLEVNHKDGDKTNNSAENLEWVEHGENLRHAYETGLRADDVSPKAVIATNIETGEQIEFPSIYSASKALNISKGNICMCCQGNRPYAGGFYWEYKEE